MNKAKQTESKTQLRLIMLALALMTCAVYCRVVGFSFINYDDPTYVMNNPHLKGGLSLANLAWAFNVGYCSNWHPLTWISHMVDTAIFGAKAGGHHAVNLLLHMANTLLLFLVLNRLTRSQWKSAFVAALFAVHPLHVESVAWISERKDVLSTLFWILTVWAYANYAESSSAKRYALVAVLFALGLMAKPMLVTLPIVLLLLDYWPLKRVRSAECGVRNAQQPASTPQHPISKLVLEKVPLLLLSLGSSILTFIAQRSGASVSSLGTLAPGMRAENAVVSYAAYLVKTVWPSGLAPFYPFPLHGIPAWQVMGSVLLLGTISLLVYRCRKGAPYLVFGWLWYVITLLPVIGLVQVGSQAMADRYTYVPLIGVFVMIAWGVPELLKKSGVRIQESEDPGKGERAKGRKGEPELPTLNAQRSTKKVPHQPSTINHQPLVPIAACLSIMVLSVSAWVQVGYWKSSIVLFTRTMNVTTDNYTAYANLASAYAEQKDYKTAEPYYAKAVQLRTDMPSLHFDYGNALYMLGKLDQAIEEYKKTLDLNPNDEEAHNNLMAIERKRQDAARAREIMKESGQSGADAITHLNKAVVLDGEGKVAEAEHEYREAIRLNPNFAEAHSNLGVLLRNKGDLDGAIAEYRKAIASKPNLVEAHNNLAITCYFKGDFAEAWHEVYECYRLGYQPPADFIQALSQKMPDPGQ